MSAEAPFEWMGISLQQVILAVYPFLLIPPILLLYIESRRRKRLATRPVGCRQIGLKGRSNIEDEYDDDKYARGVEAGNEPSGEPRWKVKGLFVYPIKSCAPVELEISDVDGSGLEWDRKFAFAELLTPTARPGVSEEEKKPIWTFRTQRQPGYEKLVHVKSEIWVPDANELKNMTLPRSKADKDGVLVVKYPNIPSGPLAALDRLAMFFGLIPSERSFNVPLNPPFTHNYPSDDVVIWGNTPCWLNYGIHVPDDFKKYLGVTNPFTLFRADPASYREVFRCAPRKEELGYQSTIGFADSYPVHLLNLASVRDVAAKVKSSIPSFSSWRFRPNILIIGPPAYHEDNWGRIRIGQHEFYCVCHTVRCRLPNVDPHSSERHPVEPDKTLKSFRCIDEGDSKNACMGMQLVPATDKGATLKVGLGVEVLTLNNNHKYIRR